MKDWKIKQELYHRLNVVHEDDLSKVNIQKTNNVVDDAIKYFNERDIGWIYPSKSYVVAICYAWWLSHDFQEDFADLLNDKDLLYGNDPYFKPYSEDTDTYNAITYFKKSEIAEKFFNIVTLNVKQTSIFECVYFIFFHN